MALRARILFENTPSRFVFSLFFSPKESKPVFFICLDPKFLSIFSFDIKWHDIITDCPVEQAHKIQRA